MCSSDLSIGQTETGAEIQKVYEIIKSHYEICRTDLARKTSKYADKDRLDVIIKTLHDAGLITSRMIGNKLNYVVTE